MRTRRGVLVVIVTALMFGGLLMAVPAAPVAARAPVCFTETNQCIQGRFLTYWESHGGLALNGYPLTGERQELLEDGKTYTVQYFERVRLEYHPENPPPWDIELGQFGRRVLREQFGYEVTRYQAAIAPTPPAPGTTYFPQTGHNLGGGFRDYWNTHGGLAQFGYPLTEEFTQTLEDGQPYTVQYFERARLEWHPGNPAPWDFELGQFGRQLLAQTALLSGRFGVLYTTDERVRGLLGVPTSAVVQAPGATQVFERGRMVLYREREGGTGLISVLCGDPTSGQMLMDSRFSSSFIDPWDPSRPVGGGPGPAPGLYEPKYGFGIVWRLYVAVHDCLGYATSADATTYMMTVQLFTRGVLVSTSDGQAAYILYREFGAQGKPIARYERVALPTR